MQDRFKFRQWVSGHYEYFDFTDNDIDIHIGFDKEYDFEKYPIEQCTGLKDKNGNLIYVGDIVRTGLKSPVTYRIGESDRPCITLYDVDVENPDIDAPNQTWCDLWGVEIIGNIHTATEKE